MLEFVFEDESLFVLNKPAGIHSVALTHSHAPSLASLLLTHYPFLESVARKTGDAGLVQRLDFETSGLILGAKNRETWEALFAMLKEGKITKSYVALVERELQKPTKIEGALGTPKRRAKKIRVYREGSAGRVLPARSDFDPIRVFSEQDCTLVRVIAPTARRHQVRAHAASIGHALIGDTLYGSTRSLEEVRGILVRAPQEGERFLLQAKTLKFIHPRTGKQIECEASSSIVAA